MIMLADRVDVTQRHDRGKFSLEEAPRELCEADPTSAARPDGHGVDMVGKRYDNPYE
ncbi:MAG: hypothetical protein J4G11_09305 [Acidimicrobiia bacterium]|nr:hypothetical protein [Acidimicrobiia bacterium]